MEFILVQLFGENMQQLLLPLKYLPAYFRRLVSVTGALALMLTLLHERLQPNTSLIC